MTNSGLNSSTEIAVIIRMNTEKNIQATPIANRNLDIMRITWQSHDNHMTPSHITYITVVMSLLLEPPCLASAFFMNTYTQTMKYM